LVASLDEVFRQEWGRVVATLIGLLGDVDLAEESAQEAFAIAAQRWPRDGIPDQPRAWLMRTARNRATDRIRRDRTLATKLDLWRSGGRLFRDGQELFGAPSWVAVLLGQGIVPKHYHPSPRGMRDQELAQVLSSLKAGVAQSVARLPKHQDFINSYCRTTA